MIGTFAWTCIKLSLYIYLDGSRTKRLILYKVSNLIISLAGSDVICLVGRALGQNCITVETFYRVTTYRVNPYLGLIRDGNN